jgi:hypothetical protein
MEAMFMLKFRATLCVALTAAVLAGCAEARQIDGKATDAPISTSVATATPTPATPTTPKPTPTMVATAAVLSPTFVQINPLNPRNLDFGNYEDRRLEISSYNIESFDFLV